MTHQFLCLHFIVRLRILSNNLDLNGGKKWQRFAQYAVKDPFTGTRSVMPTTEPKEGGNPIFKG
jgi:hypothetical protein